VGEAKYPSRGFPKVANPVSALTERRIEVAIERDEDAHLPNEDFLKGFSGMNAKARRQWLQDIEEGKFRLIPTVVPAGLDDAHQDQEMTVVDGIEGHH
jgi:hypothetical protein